jgi:hypothetical protein
MCFNLVPFTCRGPGSSFDIENDYGLDGPGSNPGGDEIFRLSRPTLGPTHLVPKGPRKEDSYTSTHPKDLRDL